MEVCSAGEAVNVRLKSGSLVRDDFRELVSSKPSQAAEEGTFGGRLITASQQRTTGRRLALRDISVADPAGNDVQADQRWNLEVIAGFGALRGASHSPLPRARHGNSVKVTAYKKPGVWPPRASFR